MQIFVHSDVSTLHEHVPKDMLPVEYGGNGCSLDEINGKFVFNYFLYLLSQVTCWIMHVYFMRKQYKKYCVSKSRT